MLKALAYATLFSTALVGSSALESSALESETRPAGGQRADEKDNPMIGFRTR